MDTKDTGSEGETKTASEKSEEDVRVSGDSVSTYTDVELRANPFLDPKTEEHYRNIYETAKYECRHVFDPHLEWTPAEERKVVRKIDWHVCTWACVMFWAMNIDRKNLVQAVSDNMLDQLNLTTDQYNYGNTIFLVSFLLAELPSQLVSKKLGPDRWIPAQMILWSIVSASQAAMQDSRAFYACRSLLGLLVRALSPDDSSPSMY